MHCKIFTHNDCRRWSRTIRSETKRRLRMTNATRTHERRTQRRAFADEHCLAATKWWKSDRNKNEWFRTSNSFKNVTSNQLFQLESLKIRWNCKILWCKNITRDKTRHVWNENEQPFHVRFNLYSRCALTRYWLVEKVWKTVATVAGEMQGRRREKRRRRIDERTNGGVDGWGWYKKRKTPPKPTNFYTLRRTVPIRRFRSMGR